VRSQSAARSALALAAALSGAVPVPAALAAPAAAEPAKPPQAAAACDDSLKTAFRPDALTEVTLVRAFAKGDDLSLDGRPGARKAAADVCLVKLMIGPGHAGPAGAPSTSQGIGVEVWLPAPGAWNGRLHLLGGGGYAGDPAVSSLVQSSGQAAQVAMTEGAVSAVTDTGHVGAGGFAFTPDGKLNADLWRDFSSRSLHEMVVKTKALASAYYGLAPRHAYWDGCSTGGRQGLKLVQDYPGDVDAALVGAPAINWTRFITAELYPQIVMLRDLGGPIAPAKLTAVSAAAVSACDAGPDGRHDGFISVPEACRYDPLKDPKLLCATDGGLDAGPACLTRREAAAIDKIWYGQTQGGSATDPASDNGVRAQLAPGQLWFGLTRGTNLVLLAGSNAFPIASTQVALDMGDVRLAPPGVPGGQDGWKALGYADLARAQAAGIARQAELADINTDKVDLSAFRARGGKILMYYGCPIS
jgi:feruloyl esterase